MRSKQVVPDFETQLARVQDVWRDNRSLKRASIGQYLYWIRRFHQYCMAKALSPDEHLTQVGVDVFAQWYAQQRRVDAENARQGAQSALRAWAFGLSALGVEGTPWQARTDGAFQPEPQLRGFAEHLRQHRGNPDSTIKKKLAHIRSFLAFIDTQHRPLQDLLLTDVDAFLMACSQRYARTTTADIGSSLRGYLRFLLTTEQMSNDLASFIVTPVVRRYERPLRALPWADVLRILAAIDRKTPVGLRDYTVLLLMSSYGLGAGEVIRLTLDDIDWQAATLHVVRPKTGVAFVLPLLPALALALVSYLKSGRPRQTPTRHLFLSMRAPHYPLSASSAIRHMLVGYARTADVTAAYLGSHVLRHTHACRQMELETSPKVISDILGHRSLTSLSAYLRIDTAHLRQLPLPVPR
ncbi:MULTISPECIES: tyrosine-type recombinase/integrase [unclassified Marinobacter]|uniref:tyrosine-type recombinase/integrase n=1 Tax=unclassified Marinobacter TaxID=83889 RepID=UPI002010C30C|nr:MULTISPECIES: tyrosine-type recombinase/integrase [unclassified Marinobacter]UQG55163.1 tyrosine-type recombinase/integrase [Marinobacter sp. M4C]UQG63965.1 tyrosine-type recombinase/integrase [Marinobacter sp. M2C]UQG68248.1 tyrosine-type recombinase/integrase [Marinobacter sp. M1C]